MVDFENKPVYGMCDLKKIMKLLRGPGGCPWDSEQTHESIRRNLLEEAYEAAEAIDGGGREELIEELGDVLMQVLFHAEIAEEAGSFNLDDIADATCKKLIRRHPHVFGDVTAPDSTVSLSFWDEAKRGEKRQDTTAEAMRSVARSLPSLWMAEKIQQKAAKDGFDWPECSGAMNALKSEAAELEEAISLERDIEGEIGDVLFSAVNVARFCGVDAEQALRNSCDKFISRFSALEKSAQESGRELRGMALEEMEELYIKAKENEPRRG